MGLGKYIHYTVDLILISMILAGMKKTSGLTLSPRQLFVSSTAQGYIKKYLRFGEYCFDSLIKYCRTSDLFRAKRVQNLDDMKDRFRQGVNDFIDESSKSI